MGTHMLDGNTERDAVITVPIAKKRFLFCFSLDVGSHVTLTEIFNPVNMVGGGLFYPDRECEG